MNSKRRPFKNLTGPSRLSHDVVEPLSSRGRTITFPVKFQLVVPNWCATYMTCHIGGLYFRPRTDDFMDGIVYNAIIRQLSLCEFYDIIALDELSNNCGLL